MASETTVEELIASFDAELPVMLPNLIRRLREGYSFVQCMTMSVEEVPLPVANQFQLLIESLKHGTPLVQALDELLERVPSESLNLFIAGYKVRLEYGGHVADILETVLRVLLHRKAL